MSSVTSAVSSVGSAVGSAVSSVASGVQSAVRSVWNNPIGRAAIIAAGVFFGAPAAAGALGIGAGGGAGLSMGAASWWSSTLGVGAASGGAAAAGSAAGATGGTALGAAGAQTAAAGVQAATSGAAAGVGSATAAGAGSAAAGGGGFLSTAGGALKGVGGKVAGAWSNASPLVKSSIINTGGQMVAGAAQSRAEAKALEDAHKREVEEQKRQENQRSIYGVRFDGEGNQSMDLGQQFRDAYSGFEPLRYQPHGGGFLSYQQG